ncbi:universal stress protein [Halopseudomonas pelagia]|uniref:universal stress protein n=1 Tax=Halopseudomonas pelagia TaxID=553151 RepID=UPI00048BB1AF|nr:universal stress protein [Halopseudomonas pelagia]
MSKFNRLLLIAPIEMTRTPAFDRADALASATGAMLHIMALDNTHTQAGSERFRSEAQTQAQPRSSPFVQLHRHWLEQQARHQQGFGLQPTVEVIEPRSTLDCVPKRVRDFPADMVIKDSQYVPAPERDFHLTLDWLLLRDCPAHLHLVTDGKNPKPLKILAAIDLSHLEELSQGLNDRILDVASTLAASCGAALHLLNVSAWAVLGGNGTSVPTSTLQTSLRDAVNDVQDEALGVLAERYEIEKKRRHHLVGVPHQVLIHFARQQAFDILVLGTAYQHAAGRYLGSTTEQVLNQAPCSLIIVKPLP